ncbi:MAG: GAF domain-containing protein [bacterium]
MPEMISGLLSVTIVLLGVLFLLVRLRLLSDHRLSGSGSLLAGGALLLAASSWQVVKGLGAYREWFLDSVYLYLDMSQYLLYLGGLVLVVVAISLYADSWQTRKTELEIREQKLSVLDDLRHETRQPYQLMQLLNISIKEIVAHLPECAGAVFLLNRSRRQFVLASAVGLTKQETTALEYYPLERNLVSQAVDLGEPLIAGKFDFIKRSSDRPVESRFNSCLLLPLMSGTDRIGGLILFAQQEKYFSNSEIRYLAPVADWLAEKIRSARLTRELAAAKRRLTTTRQNTLN